MCIIIVKPAGQDLDFEEMKEAWENNDDGGGFMFSENGSLVVCKGYMKFRAFKKAYKKRDLMDRNVVVHFRISTSGEIDQANCHPHVIYRGLAVAHNGIFASKDIPIKDKAFSDTVHFCRMLKAFNDPNFLEDAEVQQWIKEVSWSSKLVFMNSIGEYSIVNESDGDWNNGLWYSNLSYLYPQTYSYQGYTGSGHEWLKGVDGEWYKGKKADVARCDWCGGVLCYETEKNYDICEQCLGKMWEGIANEREDNLAEPAAVNERIGMDGPACLTCGCTLIYDCEIGDLMCQDCEAAAVLRRESQPSAKYQGRA